MNLALVTTGPGQDGPRANDPPEPSPHQDLPGAGLSPAWDALVVGAGPAGSIVSLRLAARGYRVLLLDRSRFPRDKTCGDGLLPDSLQVLARAGVLERVLHHGHLSRSASVLSPSRIECEIPGQYLTLRRRVLDALLAQKAVEAGAHFCQAEVKHLATERHGTVACVLSGSDRTYRARVVVVATGANVGLLQKLGMVLRRRSSGSAVRCYVRSPVRLERLAVCYDRSTVPGYSWIFPLGDGVYNVGSAVFHRGAGRAPFNLRAAFHRFTTELPLARDLLRAGAAVSPLTGASLRCGLRGVAPVGPGNILAVGEAIGATYPSTGEGIGKAMETAELAAEIIDQAFRSGNLGGLRAFPARLEEKWRPRYHGFEAVERWIARPWVNDLVAWRARQSRFYREALGAILNHNLDPRTAFSLRGLLTSFRR